MHASINRGSAALLPAPVMLPISGAVTSKSSTWTVTAVDWSPASSTTTISTV